jgi:glyoxylase I family protein
MPQILGAAHVALTVRDMDVSADWYERVFGWQVVRRFGVAEAGSPRVLLYDADSKFALSVCQPEPGDPSRFDYHRTGLDHFALAVASADELAAWVLHLDGLEIAHSPVRDLGRAQFVSFEDPDGIQIELWLQLVQPDGTPISP